MVDEGVVDLGAVGVNVAPRVWRQRQVIIGVDVEGVDLGSRPVVVGEDDVEVPLAKVLVEASRRGSLMMFAKALLQKVFGRGNVGVDAKGVEEAPRADVLTEVVSVCRRCWRRQCWCRRRRCQRSSFC